MSRSILINNVVNVVGEVDEALSSGIDISNNNDNVFNDVIGENLPILLNGDVADYDSLLLLEKAVGQIYDTVKKIKDDVDIKNFVLSGNEFDVDILRKKFNNKKLYEKFPNFNIEKYLEVINNPVLKLENFKGDVVHYDSFVIRKILIAINQMIFNEMDIYVLNIGKEGSGKSTLSSQLILYLHWILTYVGLIEYAYDIRRMYFSDILSFLAENETQEFNDYFRIRTLDEGNELQRSNFGDENVKQFKYEMRTDRKMLRIILINIQQIGELDTSVSLSRVNFIFDCRMKSDKKTGTLDKGFVDMYIIPRGDYIYSEKYKKLLSGRDILNSFANKLDKKKDYYIGLPKDCIVHSFKFDEVWGFDKEVYDRHIKSENQKRKFQKSIKLTTLQAYILITKFSDFKRFKLFDLNSKVDKKKYDVMYKFFEKIKLYFDDNADKVIGLEKFYDKVYEDSDVDDSAEVNSTI